MTIGKLINFLRGQPMILFSSSPQMAVGRVQPPTRFVEGLFPGDKSTRRGTGHLRPFSAEIMNAWSYTSTSPHVLSGAYRDKFTFTLFFYMLLYAHSQSKRNVSVCCDPSCTHDKKLGLRFDNRLRRRHRPFCLETKFRPFFTILIFSRLLHLCLHYVCLFCISSLA